MGWPPLPDDPDSGAESYAVIDSFPENKRLAAAALLDLPPGHQVSTLVDPLDHTVIVGALTAAALLVDLWHDVATAEQVVGMLTRQRLIRPGLAEDDNPRNREEPPMTATTQTATFHAVVFTNPHTRDQQCDHNECPAPAEFEVGCADSSGALVADVLAHVCVEHLAAQVRRDCES